MPSKKRSIAVQKAKNGQKTVKKRSIATHCFYDWQSGTENGALPPT
jgi:hypothetical protein